MAAPAVRRSEGLLPSWHWFDFRAWRQRLIRWYRGAGQAAASETAYRMTLAERPHDSRCLSRLGRLLSRERRHAEAAVIWQQITKLKPQASRPAFQLARALHPGFAHSPRYWTRIPADGRRIEPALEAAAETSNGAAPNEVIPPPGPKVLLPAEADQRDMPARIAPTLPPSERPARRRRKRQRRARDGCANRATDPSGRPCTAQCGRRSAISGCGIGERASRRLRLRAPMPPRTTPRAGGRWQGRQPRPPI